MSIFTSSKERALWIVDAIVVALIFSTLGIAGRLAENIPREVVDNLFVFGFFMLVAAIVAVALFYRPSVSQLAILTGLVAVLVMVASRMGIPEERTHLFEYALVGTLTYQALVERSRHSGGVGAPAVMAFLITAGIGWLDEIVQYFLPDRVYDWRDVGFNLLAAFLSVAFAATVEAIRKRRAASGA